MSLPPVGAGSTLTLIFEWLPSGAESDYNTEIDLGTQFPLLIDDSPDPEAVYQCVAAAKAGVDPEEVRVAILWTAEYPYVFTDDEDVPHSITQTMQNYVRGWDAVFGVLGHPVEE